MLDLGLLYGCCEFLHIYALVPVICWCEDFRDTTIVGLASYERKRIKMMIKDIIHIYYVHNKGHF